MQLKRLDICGLSIPGTTHEVNHDRFAIAALSKEMHMQRSNLPIDDDDCVHQRQGRLLMVADGISGGPAAARASERVVESITRYFLSEVPWHHLTDGKADDVKLALEDAILNAQSDLMNEAGDAQGLGTTLTMAFISYPDLYIAHVGDSRCYLHRDGRTIRLTKDHTVAAMRRRIGVEPQPGDAHVLWNAVGGPSRELHFETHHATLQPGDVLALVTDGVIEGQDEAEAMAVLAGDRSAEAMCADLTGGRASDDKTAIVARFLPHVEQRAALDDSDRTPAPRAQCASRPREHQADDVRVPDHASRIDRREACSQTSRVA